MKARAIRVLGWLTGVAFIVALALAVIVALRDQDWRALDLLWRPGAMPGLTAALLLNLAGLVLSMFSWRYMLVALAGPVGLALSWRIYFIGYISTSLPGPLWGAVAQARLGRAAGIGPAQMAAIYIANLPVGIVTGATTGLLVVGVLPGDRAVWLAGPAAIVVAWLIWPTLVYRLASVLLRLVRRSPSPRVPSRAIRRSITTSLLAWIISGLQLWIIVLLLGGPVWRSLPLCIGGFALAVTAGGLAFFLPAGFGVREVVLTVTLGVVLPPHAALAAAVASRVVVMASEILATAPAAVAGRKVTANGPALNTDTSG
jgi:glycosyltransferase 2 family protein